MHSHKSSQGAGPSPHNVVHPTHLVVPAAILHIGLHILNVQTLLSPADQHLHTRRKQPPHPKLCLRAMVAGGTRNPRAATKVKVLVQAYWMCFGTKHDPGCSPYLQLLLAKHAHPLRLDQLVQPPIYKPGEEGPGMWAQPRTKAPIVLSLTRQMTGSPEERCRRFSDLLVEAVIGHTMDVSEPVVGCHCHVPPVGC